MLEAIGTCLKREALPMEEIAWIRYRAGSPLHDVGKNKDANWMGLGGYNEATRMLRGE